MWHLPYQAARRGSRPSRIEDGGHPIGERDLADDVTRAAAQMKFAYTRFGLHTDDPSQRLSRRVGRDGRESILQRLPGEFVVGIQLPSLSKAKQRLQLMAGSHSLIAGPYRFDHQVLPGELKRLQVFSVVRRELRGNFEVLVCRACPRPLL